MQVLLTPGETIGSELLVSDVESYGIDSTLVANDSDTNSRLNKCEKSEEVLHSAIANVRGQSA